MFILAKEITGEMKMNKRDLGAVSGTAPACSIDSVSVGVVIPTYNHARFLADAISSVLTQTRAADEIIVVDDGSTDDPESVVAQFPKVQVIRQDNRGLAAARNTGLRNCSASLIVFLDADDRLLPSAIEAGLACFALRPECAFVYGGYRRISENGTPFGPDIFYPINGDGHLTLIQFNIIQMHAAVLYRRDCLLTVGGFDESLRRLEDHDIYLRTHAKISSRESSKDCRRIPKAHVKHVRQLRGAAYNSTQRT